MPYQGYNVDVNGNPTTPSGLYGVVDWAVFQQTAGLPNNVPLGMSGGYTLTGSQATSGYLYTYQAYEQPQPDGIPSVGLSSIAITLDTTLVQNIGNFLATGISGDSPIDQRFHLSLSPFTAQWKFNDVLAGNSTVGLAFWSPNPPVNSIANTVDGGTTGMALPVPSPSPQGIPEPSTLVLAVLGLIGFAVPMKCMRRWRRRSSPVSATNKS